MIHFSHLETNAHISRLKVPPSPFLKAEDMARGEEGEEAGWGGGRGGSTFIVAKCLSIHTAKASVLMVPCKKYRKIKDSNRPCMCWDDSFYDDRKCVCLCALRAPQHPKYIVEYFVV